MKITARQVSFPAASAAPGDARKEEKFNFSLPFMGENERGREEGEGVGRVKGRLLADTLF